MTDTATPTANPSVVTDGPAPMAKPAPPPRPAPKPANKPEVVVRPVAQPARRKRRHWGLLFTFLLMVIGPIAVTWWYLSNRAADQYASTLGFTVRSEDVTSASDLLGGLGATLGVGSGGAQDSDILYEFIRSQELVRSIDEQLDLRTLFSGHTAQDPVFGFHTEGQRFGLEFDGTIEDLTAYWQRMVRLSYDQNSGLMELQVRAFAPEDAQSIALAIYDESSRMINALSATAREDATRYAREDLDLAIERLKETREALTAFRVENEIVDVTADIQGQMGLLNALQSLLAEARIDFDLLSSNAREGDPRLIQAQARIDAIEIQIAAERQQFGGGGGDDSYAQTIADFERLAVDGQFAEQSYVAALAAYDAARAEANRQSRYLAAYIQPTIAEKSEFPQHGLIIGLVSLFTFLGWTILALVYYSLRDRR